MAIREEQKLELESCDENDKPSQRRGQHCIACEDNFCGKGDALRRQWRLLESS